MLPKVEAAKADRGWGRCQIAEQKAASFLSVKNSSTLHVSAKLSWYNVDSQQGDLCYTMGSLVCPYWRSFITS